MFPTFTEFFQVNIFVQMYADKYIYMISENEIMYSSGYATILTFRLRQTDKRSCITVCNENILKDWKM